MTIIAIVPLLIALVGAVVYFVAGNPKLAELGRIAFACGLLVFTFGVAGHVIRIG